MSDCPRVASALATEAAPPLYPPQFGLQRKNVRLARVWAQTTGRMTRGNMRGRRQREKQGEEEDGESEMFFFFDKSLLVEKSRKVTTNAT